MALMIAITMHNPEAQGDNRTTPKEWKCTVALIEYVVFLLLKCPSLLHVHVYCTSPTCTCVVLTQVHIHICVYVYIHIHIQVHIHVHVHTTDCLCVYPMRYWE